MKLLKTYTKKRKFLPNGTGTPAGPETPSADRAPAEGCRCGGHQPLEPRDPVQHERARSGGPVGGGGAHPLHSGEPQNRDESDKEIEPVATAVLLHRLQEQRVCLIT